MPYSRFPLIELTLSTGRRIWARSLYIEETYEGLLEGFPSSRINDGLLAVLPNQLTRTFGPSSVHVIEPTRTIELIRSAKADREAEFLPRYWLASDFTSTPMNRE